MSSRYKDLIPELKILILGAVLINTTSTSDWNLFKSKRKIVGQALDEVIPKRDLIMLAAIPKKITEEKNKASWRFKGK